MFAVFVRFIKRNYRNEICGLISIQVSVSFINILTDIIDIFVNQYVALDFHIIHIRNTSEEISAPMFLF